MARKRGASKEVRKPQRAFFVDRDGTDAQMAEWCAEAVEGWETLAEQERAEVISLMRSFARGGRSARMEIVADGEQRYIRIADEANATLQSLRLTKTFATRSQSFVNDRVSDLTAFARPGVKGGLSAGSDQLNAALAFVAGGQPTDTVQSTLLVQMAATHDAAMRALGASARADYIPQAQMFGNLATKLLNTYTRQAEVLAKLQRGGEQVIKHMYIDNRGGQTVVAEQLVTGGGGNAESREQAHEQGAFSPALLGPDPFGNVVPMPGAEGQEPVQAARGGVHGRA